MLSIARAMIEPRKLFLIDEPTKGLAPAIIANMISAFRELKKSPDTTILVVEQNFLFAKSLGDAVAVMENGRVVHAGTMAALADDRDLQNQLLGLHLDQHQ
jgi:branched-chain amino acid transport system ATP-binding protein